MKAILCFGDSITQGRGELPNTGWVGRLKDEFEAEGGYRVVYNLGIPGDTSDDLLKRFKAECSARIRFHRPENRFLILISIGMNDARWLGAPGEQPCVPPAKFKSNVERLIEQGLAAGAKVACIGLTPVHEQDDYHGKPALMYEQTSFQNERIAQYNETIKLVCSQRKVPFLDMFSLMYRSDYPSLLEDSLHPNPEGYDFMFEKIRKFVRDERLS